jgi:hypothetical protein
MRRFLQTADEQRSVRHHQNENENEKKSGAKEGRTRDEWVVQRNRGGIKARTRSKEKEAKRRKDGRETTNGMACPLQMNVKKRRHGTKAAMK